MGTCFKQQGVTGLHQRCENPECQVGLVTTFCTMTSNIWGLIVELALYHPSSTYILRWLVDFWKICVPVVYIIWSIFILLNYIFNILVALVYENISHLNIPLDKYLTKSGPCPKKPYH